jgi:hypothetical protein
MPDAEDDEIEEVAEIEEQEMEAPPRVGVAMTILYADKDAPKPVHLAACAFLVRYLSGEVDS